MEVIKEILADILKIFKELVDIERQHLEMQKADRELLQESVKIQSGMLNNVDKMQEAMFDDLGIKEKIGIDNIELLGNDEGIDEK